MNELQSIDTGSYGLDQDLLAFNEFVERGGLTSLVESWSKDQDPRIFSSVLGGPEVARILHAFSVSDYLKDIIERISSEKAKKYVGRSADKIQQALGVLDAEKKNSLIFALWGWAANAAPPAVSPGQRLLRSPANVLHLRFLAPRKDMYEPVSRVAILDESDEPMVDFTVDCEDTAYLISAFSSTLHDMLIDQQKLHDAGLLDLGNTETLKETLDSASENLRKTSDLLRKYKKSRS